MDGTSHQLSENGTPCPIYGQYEIDPMYSSQTSPNLSLFFRKSTFQSFSQILLIAPLFIPEGDQRIDSRGSSRRDITRQSGDGT